MRKSLLLAPLLALASGCIIKTTDQPQQNNKSNGAPGAAATASPSSDPQLSTMLTRINQAAPQNAAANSPASASSDAQNAPPGAKDAPPDPLVIRAEVLLARARFSPGVVDGQFGTNFKHALAAFQQAHDLPDSGTVDDRTWGALVGNPGSGSGGLAAAASYTITAADVAGPFAADVGEDFVKLAALPDGPQFTNPLEELAERFHMSQDLLKALNPRADFAKAGTRILVVDDNPPAFAKGDVTRIDVSKSQASARAYDGDDRLVAFYPATVGSTERPSPSGTHKVVGVAWHPDYTYDPTKLAWGPRSAGKLVIKPGPNNPVGAVWIDLNAPSYGIHGTPDPDKIGKTASHGCVRLTNWDAQALAHGVKPGVTVRFLGERGEPSAS